MPPRKSPLTFAANEKLPLPVFLKMLTEAGLAMDKAIAAASKVYKTHNTPAMLGQLTDGALAALHVAEKGQRRLVLAAVKKAGFATPLVKDPAAATTSAAAALARHPTSLSNAKKPSPRKRKRDDDLNEAFPEGTGVGTVDWGNFDFNELLDEQSLKTKSAIVNRAPVMTAWATVVAERMGFGREEALSIASVYTEMNATSKGVKLGIFEEGKGKGMEPKQDDAQPYVDLMGRRPVFATKSSHWRALLKGEPVPPTSAFKYITNSFRQTSGHIIGAMRLLAGTYTPEELNRVGFGLYADFRPHVDGWGKKGDLKCESILALRRAETTGHETGKQTDPDNTAPELMVKNPKVDMSVEEYEAALDDEGYEEFFKEEAV